MDNDGVLVSILVAELFDSNNVDFHEISLNQVFDWNGNW